MKVRNVLIVSTIVAVGTTGLFAKETGMSSRSIVDVLRRETNELREVMSLDVMELMRAAKSDFIQIKGATKGDKDLEQLVIQFVEKMDTIDRRLKIINYQIVPRILKAAGNGNPDGSQDGQQNNHHVSNEAQYSGEQIAEKLKRVKPLGHASADSRRLEKLKSYITVTHFPNGGAGVRAILNSFEYNSNRASAAQVMASACQMKLRTQHVKQMLSDIKGDSTRMQIAKQFVFHTIDLNAMNIDELVSTFEYPMNRQEIADICSKLLL